MVFWGGEDELGLRGGEVEVGVCGGCLGGFGEGDLRVGGEGGGSEGGEGGEGEDVGGYDVCGGVCYEGGGVGGPLRRAEEAASIPGFDTLLR